MSSNNPPLKPANKEENQQSNSNRKMGSARSQDQQAPKRPQHDLHTRRLGSPVVFLLRTLAFLSLPFTFLDASLKNSLNLDSSTRDQPPPHVSVHFTSSKVESCRKAVWGTVLQNSTQLYPGSHWPEKLVSNIKKHYDALPLSHAQAGFDIKEVYT